jgi:hypothetical protein
MGFHYWYRTVKENRNLVDRKKAYVFNKKSVEDGFTKRKIRYKSLPDRILEKNRLRIKQEIAYHNRRHKINIIGSIVVAVIYVLTRYGHLFSHLW